jgi:hypothetical protein
MVAEKWVQVFIDIIKAKGCVTRHYVIDYIVNSYNIPRGKALNIVDDTLANLVKRGVITRKGRGVYCWSGPP